MARIHDIAVTIFAATTTANMVCNMPEHAAGDLLLAFVGKDGNSLFTTPSTIVGTPVSSGGWTVLRNSTSAGAAGGVYALRAASSSENVTFPLTIDTCLAVIVCVKDVFGTTVADAVPNTVGHGAEDSVMPFAGQSITTLHANALLFSSRFQDTTVGTSHLPPWVNLFVGDAANGGCCVAYAYEPTAGTVVAAPEMWGGGADDGKACTIEVRDGSSGAHVPPYIPLDVIPAVLVSPLVGTTGAAIERGTYVAAASIAITTVAGKTVTGVAVANTADSGYNPFRGAMRNAGVTSDNNLNHVELDLTTPQNITAGGLLFGTFLHLNPRDYLDLGTVAQGGKYFLAGSSSANWRAWVVGGQFSKTDSPDKRGNYLIEVDYSASEYDSAGTPNWASLDYLAFGSAGIFGGPAILWNELWELRTAVLAGGSLTNPFNFDALIDTVNHGCGELPLLVKAGSAVTVWIPLQIGGNEPIGVAVNLRTFQWPRQADPTLGYVDFHVSNDKLGIEFHGLGSGDLIHFTNCVFTSDSSYYWRFDAAHDVNTDIDFSGCTVVGANVTLRSTVSLSSVTFINSSAFAQNNAALADCGFQNTKITSDNPADISDCSFASGGTGHAIEITAPGTYSFVGNVFSGYGADGTTDAAIYNNSGGAVTLNISGGGGTPTVRNGAGASTTVNNSTTITIEAQVSLVGAEIRIYDLDNMPAGSLGTELSGVESAPGATYAYAGAPGNAVWIQVMLSGFVEFGQEIEMPATNQTISIVLQPEANE